MIADRPAIVGQLTFAGRHGWRTLAGACATNCVAKPAAAVWTQCPAARVAIIQDDGGGQRSQGLAEASRSTEGTLNSLSRKS